LASIGIILLFLRLDRLFTVGHGRPLPDVFSFVHISLAPKVGSLPTVRVRLW
jgi:hypothetical protein